MADVKITDLPEVTEVADDDQVLLIDVSDSTAGPNGTDKRSVLAKLADLLFKYDVETAAELEASSPIITGRRAICQERANANYLLGSPGTVAKFGDIVAANGRVWVHQVNGPVNAKEFGFGTGDQTANLQAIADWLDENRHVYFTEDFSITSTVTFSNSGTVDFGNITIDGTGLPNSTTDRTLNQALVFTGSLETSASIDASIAAGDNSFTSSAATGIVKGDTVIVRSDEPFVDGWSGSVSNRRGEILTIASVSGSTYEVEENFKFSYTQANNLRVEKMNPIKTFIKGGTLQMGGVGSEHRGLQLIYARNSIIKNLVVKGAEDTSVSIEYSHTVDYKGKCFDATTPTSNFNTGYGVACINGSRNIDIYVVGNNCKHVVTAGGFLPSLETRVKGVAYDSGRTATAFDCHEPCFGWVWDVECYGGNAGIGIRGSEQKVKIKARNIGSNAVRVQALDNVGLQYGIDIEIDSDGTGSSAVVLQSGTQPLEDVTIKGRIKNTLVNGFASIGNATYGIGNVKVDLDVDGSASRSYDFRYTKDVQGKIRCRNSGERGAQAFDSSDIDLDVDVESDINNAIYLLRSNKITLKGKKAYSGNTASVFTDECNDVSVKIASIEAIGSSSDCWRAVDTVGGKLFASTLKAGRHGVYSSGSSDRFIIGFNDASTVTNFDKFLLSGANNQELGNLS